MKRLHGKQKDRTTRRFFVHSYPWLLFIASVTTHQRVYGFQRQQQLKPSRHVQTIFQSPFQQQQQQHQQQPTKGNRLGIAMNKVSFSTTTSRNKKNVFVLKMTKQLEEEEAEEEGLENESSLSRILSNTITKDVQKSIYFSILMILCGAILGPFLDSYHSAFGVLQYDEPITSILWGGNTPLHPPALITAWWVPELFGLAGFLIGWLYIIFDAIFRIQSNPNKDSKEQQNQNLLVNPSPPKILLGISLFTFQYWLSGVLFFNSEVTNTEISWIMSFFAITGFLSLDATISGFITSAATALGGPLIEIGLISMFRSNILPGGYHYTDLSETGFFPLFIIPIYFLGGPAVGNLARGFWNMLSSSSSNKSSLPSSSQQKKQTDCNVCNNTRRVACPNCDGIGNYVAMGGRNVQCNCCKGRGYVICRSCFSSYDEDPFDINSIREMMSRMPD